WFGSFRSLSIFVNAVACDVSAPMMPTLISGGCGRGADAAEPPRTATAAPNANIFPVIASPPSGEQTAVRPVPEHRDDDRRRPRRTIDRHEYAARDGDVLPPAQRDLPLRQDVPEHRLVEGELVAAEDFHHRGPRASPVRLHERLAGRDAPEEIVQ